MPKVLHIDDNPNVRSFVEPNLRAEGFVYLSAPDGRTGLALMESEKPDIVVLDVMLEDPDFSGLDVCKRIRESGSHVPVIFLTVKDRTADSWYMERAFSIGGDDFIAKREELRDLETRMGLVPTEMLDRKSDVEELVARIKARLPRQAAGIIEDSYLKIDLNSETVHVMRSEKWQNVGLTVTEFKVLRALVANSPRPISKSGILEAAGVDPSEVDVDRTVQTHIWRIRGKIEPDSANPRYVLTYHRVGYRFSGITGGSDSD